MRRVALRLALAAAGLLALTALITAPGGYEAARLLAAEDDPGALADLALDHRFDTVTAEREIATALAADDADLAQSFVALADERGVAVDAALREQVAATNADAATAARAGANFLDGLISGEPHDVAGLAGTITGDLFVFGDIRDVIRESARLARGEAADELVLGLACVGLAVTVGTYASLGAAAPARAGLSVLKAASRTGRITAPMSAALARGVHEAVDRAALAQALRASSLWQPALALRTARAAVKLDKLGGLTRLVGDMGRVQAKAGTRAALDGLRLAQSPKDVSRLARLAAAKGGKTRAVLKLLGRGAIALTIGAFNLASWVFWAVLNLLGLCVALKRYVEQATLRVVRRNRLRRARLLAQPPLAV
jgi:hypothetical protein